MAVLVLKRKRYDLGSMIPFLVLHASVLLVVTVPFSLGMIAWLAGSYFLRMFGVTGGYHRYFSHRSYKLNRFWQFCLAFLAQTSGQKGALWWAAHHRDHHLYSDRKEDLHSPVHEGFWWSHLGWILSDEYDDYDPKRIADLAKYPELRWLNTYHLVPAIIYAVAVFLLGGFPAFVWGFLVATVALYHGTFLINSLTHIWGTRRFATPDESRNNFILAIVTMGEGWHNNHHHYMSSVRQGIRWWEVDATYYVLKMLSWLGVARDLRPFRSADAADEHPA
jgi:stearoyl-CoA desaturase (delta-9 desaturase)